MPILPVLGVVFITLKLMGYIMWSWWLVLLPFWIGCAILAGALLLTGLTAFGLSGYAAIKTKRRR